jgi:hypothetical protein
VTLEVTLMPTVTFARTQDLVELPLVVLVVVPVPQEVVFTSVLTESCRDSSLQGHSITAGRWPGPGLAAPSMLDITVDARGRQGLKDLCASYTNLLHSQKNIIMDENQKKNVMILSLSFSSDEYRKIQMTYYNAGDGAH